jgi:hypothetical protein
MPEAVCRQRDPQSSPYYQCVENHFELWEIKRNSSPRSNAPPFIPDSHPIPSVDDYVIDPDYPVEAYL